jgi:hypothetical protein
MKEIYRGDAGEEADDTGKDDEPIIVLASEAIEDSKHAAAMLTLLFVVGMIARTCLFPVKTAKSSASHR